MAPSYVKELDRWEIAWTIIVYVMVIDVTALSAFAGLWGNAFTAVGLGVIYGGTLFASVTTPPDGKGRNYRITAYFTLVGLAITFASLIVS